MCLQNDIEQITLAEVKDSLWDLCMPMLQYLVKNIWIGVLGIKDIENLNDGKQIEEHFAAEADHSEFEESLKVKMKVKIKKQMYFGIKFGVLSQVMMKPKLGMMQLKL